MDREHASWIAREIKKARAAGLDFRVGMLRKALREEFDAAG